MQVEVESWKVQFFMKLTSDITVWPASFLGDASSRCKRTNFKQGTKIRSVAAEFEMRMGIDANAIKRRSTLHATVAWNQDRCRCGTAYTADSAFCRVCGEKRLPAPAAPAARGRSPSPGLSSRSKRARPESAPAASQPALFVFVVFFLGCTKDKPNHGLNPF